MLATWLGFGSTSKPDAVRVDACVRARLYTLHTHTGTRASSGMMMEITERNPEIKVALHLCTLWRACMLHLHQETQMMKQANGQRQRCRPLYMEFNNVF